MATEGLGPLMTPAVILLSAAVVAVPVFRRLGLGSVLGYFAAGLAVGPFGFGFFSDPEAMLTVSELGVVLFLFIIGLEMRPARLWTMRRQIFGIGLFQVLLCVALLTGTAMVFGHGVAPALIAASGFVLSSTAVAMSVMQERRELGTPEGQKALSILLLEDMMIVPTLALVAFLSPVEAEHGSAWLAIVIAIAAVAGMVAAGRWVLDPMFARLARAGTREVMSAGALLVVLAAALVMAAVKLSMAMGAFLAGVLLSGSSYRHQIEADIEPFRGLLMGLFFLAVGMSLDLGVVGRMWAEVLLTLVAFMAVKALGVYIVARLTGSVNRAAIQRMALFAQGGEFAFVVYAAARGAGILDGETDAIFSAVVILSMAITPLVLTVATRLIPAEVASMDGIEVAENLHGKVLLIGFGRFGQIASQGLLSQGYTVSIIDTDIEMIRAAETLGFKVYYGDGTRLDILKASGATEADLILVCVNDADEATKIVELVQSVCPATNLLVRAFDRRHSLELRKRDVAFEVRETFESAMAMGRAALVVAGMSEGEADEVIADIRQRDKARMAMQASGGLAGGRDFLHKNITDTLSSDPE